jgi:hypothetical protein
MKVTPALLLAVLAFTSNAAQALGLSEPELSAAELPAAEAQPQKETKIDAPPRKGSTLVTLDANTRGIYYRIVYNGTQISMIGDDAEIPDDCRPGFRVFVSEQQLEETYRRYAEMYDQLLQQIAEKIKESAAEYSNSTDSEDPWVWSEFVDDMGLSIFGPEFVIMKASASSLWNTVTYPITYPTTVVRDFFRRQLGGGRVDADL